MWLYKQFDVGVGVVGTTLDVHSRGIRFGISSGLSVILTEVSRGFPQPNVGIVY